tara:strand:+ start:113 stop:1180 length:1068 start_codon:yes stop_codon:yes gene_type:complete
MIITFEPVEVMSVHSDTYDETLIGAIEGRAVVTQQGQKLPTTYYPLDANVFQIPVRGEHVFGCVYAGKHYYFSKANFLNKVNNPRRGTSGYLTKGEDGGVTDRQSESRPYGAYFNSVSRVKKLWLNEGDTIIQGRFGNSIRLGSNQVESYADEEAPDYTESPNIKIVAGGFTERPHYYESLKETEVNQDDEIVREEQSSLYLTTNEFVDYKEILSKEKILTSDNYNKPQIILQSDRLIFNSVGEGSDENHEGGIGLFAKDTIEIKSNENVEIDSNKKINLGDGRHQAVLGNDDFQIVVNTILDMKISENEATIVEEFGKSGGNLTTKIVELQQENIRLNGIKTDKTYLSNKLNVE